MNINRLSDYTSSAGEGYGDENVTAQLMHTGRDLATQAAESVVRYVREQPGMALGVALALGGLIGWIAKRR